MMKNEKIQRYMEEKGTASVTAFQAHLQFFIANFEEFEEVLEEKNLLDLGDGMKKYVRLSEHIFEVYGVGKKGKKFAPGLVKNLRKLARRELEVRQLSKRKLRPEDDTVFRIFHPDDLEDDDDRASAKGFPGMSMLQQ